MTDPMTEQTTPGPDAEAREVLRVLVEEAQAMRGSHGHRPSCDKDHRDVPFPVGSHHSCKTLTTAITRARSILSTPPADTLDAAWQAVVGVLPEGWWLGGVQRYGGRWAAAAWGPTAGDHDRCATEADDPIAALRALAARFTKELTR